MPHMGWCRRHAGVSVRGPLGWSAAALCLTFISLVSAVESRRLELGGGGMLRNGMQSSQLPAAAQWRRQMWRIHGTQRQLLGTAAVEAASATTAPTAAPAPAAAAAAAPAKDTDYIVAIVVGVIVLLSLIGLVVAGAFLLGKRGGRLDAMRADAAAGALVDSDLDEEDENAAKIRETVALAREKAHDSRGMDVMGTLDLSIQGWFINPDDIEICKREDGSDWLLGAGSYGKVYKAVRGGVQDVAIKIMHEADDEQLAQFEKEIGILKSISYDKNIVQFYGASMVNREPMLLLEFCEGGDLRSALDRDNREHLPELGRQLAWDHEGQYIAQDVARGLYFLHNIDIVHGDLKTLNILLTRGWQLAKLGDVGVARYLKSKDVPDHVALGTFVYSAPEMLIGNDSGVKADIYSFGVVLWEIVTGGIAKRGRLHDPKVPGDCPQDVADLIKDCMKSVPEDRPTTREIFHRLRKCSQPRDSGGKGGGAYPGTGTGSSGGTGGSLPTSQLPKTPDVSELPRRTRSTSDVTEDPAGGSNSTAQPLSQSERPQVKRSDSSLSGLGQRMRSNSQGNDKKSGSAAISARSRSSVEIKSLPQAPPAAAAGLAAAGLAGAAAAAAAARLFGRSEGEQQQAQQPPQQPADNARRLRQSGSNLSTLAPITSGVEDAADALLDRRDSGQPPSAPMSDRASMDSVASGSTADAGAANPYAFLFPGEPAPGSAAPPPADPYAAFATGGALSSSGGSQPPNPFETPPASREPSQTPAVRAQSEGGDANPYAFLLGVPDAASEAAPGSSKAPSPYASFTSNASAPPATNGAASGGSAPPAGGSPTSDAGNPYAPFNAGSSPPAKAAASPHEAFLGGDPAVATHNGGNQAAEAVMDLAAAAQQYRANRSVSASNAERSGVNPFNNVPADWSEANGARPQVKSVGRLSVSRQGRSASAGPPAREAGGPPLLGRPSLGRTSVSRRSVGGSSLRPGGAPRSGPASLAASPAKPNLSRMSATASAASSSTNTDDMYARFLVGPESIARARRSYSAASNGVLAAKQAEAAAMAEANPYAAFSGISQAGLQSSVFQAPAHVMEPKQSAKSVQSTRAESGSGTFSGETPAELLQGVAQSAARADRPSSKRQSAPARADSQNDSPYASILGIDVADESYSPTEVLSQRIPSAPAFGRGAPMTPAKRAAPAPPAEPEEDNPYALFMTGEDEAVDEATPLPRLPSLPDASPSDDDSGSQSSGKSTWWRMQKSKVAAAEQRADAELDLLMRDLSGYDKPPSMADLMTVSLT